MAQPLFVMCVYVCICVDCEDYLYPCHQGKKPGGGNGAASVCYAVCACRSTVRGVPVFMPLGEGKVFYVACLYCSCSSVMYWCIIACEADKYFLLV